MRKLRMTAALLALVATAWSSSPVLPCGTPSSSVRAGSDHDHAALDLTQDTPPSRRHA